MFCLVFCLVLFSYDFMQSWDRSTTGRIERTSVPQEQGCEVSLNTEQMEPHSKNIKANKGVKGIPMPTDR